MGFFKSFGSTEFSVDKDLYLKITQKFDFSEQGLEEYKRKRELERMNNDQM